MVLSWYVAKLGEWIVTRFPIDPLDRWIEEREEKAIERRRADCWQSDVSEFARSKGRRFTTDSPTDSRRIVDRVNEDVEAGRERDQAYRDTDRS